MGFAYAASGPLVRSSYKAAEVFIRSMLSGDDGEAEALLAERVATARREAGRVEGGAVSRRRGRHRRPVAGEIAAKTALGVGKLFS